MFFRGRDAAEQTDKYRQAKAHRICFHGPDHCAHICVSDLIHAWPVSGISDPGTGSFREQGNECIWSSSDLICYPGDEGHNVIAQGSYHSEIIDLLSNNLAVVDEPSSKGTGNEVDMEQIFNWNPDYIIFDPSSIYSEIGNDATWQQVKAIQDGNYFEAPQGPYNWMGFPPSVQRYLGMMWMAKLLYPDAADFDLYEEVSEYFELFYHCSLSQEQFDELVKNSIGK